MTRVTKVLVKVEFQPGGTRYTYSTTEPLVVGDQVVVPTSNPFVGETTAFATVVEIGSSFKGEAKPVLYKKEQP